VKSFPRVHEFRAVCRVRSTCCRVSSLNFFRFVLPVSSLIPSVRLVIASLEPVPESTPAYSLLLVLNAEARRSRSNAESNAHFSAILCVLGVSALKSSVKCGTTTRTALNLQLPRRYFLLHLLSSSFPPVPADLVLRITRSSDRASIFPS